MVRAVLQRVAHASVAVGERQTGAIGKGILALVGVANGDQYEDLLWLREKLLNIRLWDDGKGRRWAGSVKSEGLSVLLVSQFTLHAVTRKPKPDFHRSMAGPSAKELFDRLVTDMRSSIGDDRVHTGEFGAMMNVSLLNDGPVTIILDSWNKSECGGHEPPAVVDASPVATPSSPTPAAIGAESVASSAAGPTTSSNADAGAAGGAGAPAPAAALPAAEASSAAAASPVRSA